MKRFAVSYGIGALLITGAFVTLLMNINPGPLKSKEASWILFLGGAAFVIIGWREHNEGR